MKQKYIKPELEVTKLLTEEILTASKDDEVFIGSDDLFA